MFLPSSVFYLLLLNLARFVLARLHIPQFFSDGSSMELCLHSIKRHCGHHVSYSLHYPFRLISNVAARSFTTHQSRGQFRLRLVATLSKSIHESGISCWPIDQTSSLILILPHFHSSTVRVAVAANSFAYCLHFHPLNEPFNQHFSTVTSSPFERSCFFASCFRVIFEIC